MTIPTRQRARAKVSPNKRQLSRAIQSREQNPIRWIMLTMRLLGSLLCDNATQLRKHEVRNTADMRLPRLRPMNRDHHAWQTWTACLAVYKLEPCRYRRRLHDRY